MRVSSITERAKRRLLLRLLRRQNPQKLLNSAQAALPRVLLSAARRSPAYEKILAEAGVSLETLAQRSGIDQAPILDKERTFERFPIRELLGRDVEVSRLANVLTSSGYGAVSFGFGVSDRSQHASAPEAIDLGLQNAFGIDGRRTLVINTLPMGVIFESHAACVSNVSVREDMAFAILRQAGPLFEQVVLVVDPLFCKRFLDYADSRDYDLSAQRIQMIIGEETFQEPFRDYLMQRLGVAGDADPSEQFLGSSMGVGELGLNLFFETPETVRLRRELYQLNPWDRQPMIFCYNPLRSWVEVHAPDAAGVGDLLITMMDRRATMPLPRYRTGDRVSLLGERELSAVSEPCRKALQSLPFPVLAVHGRERDQLSDHWHVDDFKSLQYRRPDLARALSGAFRVEHGDEGIRWHLQAAADARATPEEIREGLRELFLQRRAVLGGDGPELRELQVFPHSDFPYGMGLDYERKFRYAGATVPS